MIVTNNPQFQSFFGGTGTYKQAGMGRLAAMGDTSDQSTGMTTTDISSLATAATGLVTGALQAENAQNMITQENTAANSLINMLPLIVLGIGAYFLLKE